MSQAFARFALHVSIFSLAAKCKIAGFVKVADAMLEQGVV
jgi:hypothetical protein